MPRRNEADAVRNLQRYLRQLSYEDDDYLPLPIDGIFDDATRDALVRFQQKNGLEASGVADRNTWDMLFARYLSSLNFFAPPREFSPFPRVPDGYVLNLGDRGFVVNSVQFLLDDASTIQDDIGPVEITGVFDEDTERAVAIFQAATELPVTGTVDKATWDMLVDTYNTHGKNYRQ